MRLALLHEKVDLGQNLLVEIDGCIRDCRMRQAGTYAENERRLLQGVRYDRKYL
jgi:hypothetical protein